MKNEYNNISSYKLNFIITLLEKQNHFQLNLSIDRENMSQHYHHNVYSTNMYSHNFQPLS